METAILMVSLIGMTMSIAPVFIKELVTWRWYAVLTGISLLVVILSLLVPLWFVTVLYVALTGLTGWVTYKLYNTEEVDNNLPV